MDEQTTCNEWEYKSNQDDNRAETEQCAMVQRGQTTRVAIVGSILSLMACALLLINVFGELHGKCIDRGGTWKGSWCEVKKSDVTVYCYSTTDSSIHFDTTPNTQGKR